MDVFSINQLFSVPDCKTRCTCLKHYCARTLWEKNAVQPTRNKDILLIPRPSLTDFVGHCKTCGSNPDEILVKAMGDTVWKNKTVIEEREITSSHENTCKYRHEFKASQQFKKLKSVSCRIQDTWLTYWNQKQRKECHNIDFSYVCHSRHE